MREAIRGDIRDGRAERSETGGPIQGGRSEGVGPREPIRGASPREPVREDRSEGAELRGLDCVLTTAVASSCVDCAVGYVVGSVVCLVV